MEEEGKQRLSCKASAVKHNEWKRGLRQREGKMEKKGGRRGWNSDFKDTGDEAKTPAAVEGEGAAGKGWRINAEEGKAGREESIASKQRRWRRDGQQLTNTRQFTSYSVKTGLMSSDTKSQSSRKGIIMIIINKQNARNPKPSSI